ncbi:hypothetical protein COU89_02735 [Candidatus Roizmanbacteria bacterium CG10_big_fil_rev_8_21_14_0_10_45_7]|uniref:Aspartate racemase n=1 Tax=Candidatus Roizmanbacteria bacterium CG10_big_fil_rev_8_21_14_0_10_45_7 TaxID=1974854 RepID=A0A2M8KUG4_9BACT|nr:MAG: hypothetical protein COU89_02735 [Candidatus Roizmanbacteria bacterium CG10_big_fil_rev_8_21_14_0_10_45_7]
MKTVGIIGGFGPDTTAKFQLRIVELFNELSPAVRPSILMCSPSIPTALEHNLIIHGQGLGQILPHLIRSAKHLEEAGVDIIVFPCNTLHVLFNKIQNSINTPLLNIISESINVIKANQIKQIAVLGTSLTLRSNLHRNLLDNHNIKAIVPPKIEQRELDQIIHKLVTQTNSNQTEKSFQKLLERLSPQCFGNFLLACTDLQLIKLGNHHFTIFDSMEILARATVNKLLDVETASVTINKGII